MKTPFSAIAPAPASPATGPDLREQSFRRALATCSAKAQRTVPLLAQTRRSGALATNGEFFTIREGFFEIGNWTSSFFTGMGMLSFELARDLEILRQINSLAGLYRDKVRNHGMDTMHDLGFLYSLYSIGLHKLTGSLDHRNTALLAADTLAKRFCPKGRYIRAWGRTDDQEGEYAGLAIIDCMMNLPLLFWASQQTGNPFHREIATAHADTTLARFIRRDDSVFHAYRFDPATGSPLQGENFCGYGVDTHWARGTAWAIYGFALTHRYTGESRHLAASLLLARRFLSLLDDGMVPVWDFQLPPGAPALRDTSAAAIAACGLLELAARDPQHAHFGEAAEQILAALCSRFVNHDPECLGVLKEAQVGDGKIPGTPHYQAQNAYTAWGDYFLMEALARRLHGLTGYW